MDNEKEMLKNGKEALQKEKSKLKKEGKNTLSRSRAVLASALSLPRYPNMAADQAEHDILAFGSCFHVKLIHYDKE